MWKETVMSELERPNTWMAIVERQEIDEDYDIKMTDKQWGVMVHNLNKAAYNSIDAIITEVVDEM
jgi:hypothetical protein